MIRQLSSTFYGSCVIFNDHYIPSLIFSSVILSISVFPDYMVPSSKGLLEYLHLYASYRLFDSSVRLGTYYVRHPLCMCLLDATRTLSTKHVVGWNRFNVFNELIEFC